MLGIENTFQHAENDEYVLILIRGNLVKLLVKVDPKLYQKYVITLEYGVPILYVKLNKALYGMLRSTMLFYKNLRSHLEEIIFGINPYDLCVANMM